MTENAIVVKRVDPRQEADTDEIEELARSAGYDVLDVLTQSREEDREYNIGQGKVHESNLRAQDLDCDVIVIDNEMGPYQMYNYGIYVPDDIEVLDRYTLILDIFEKRANTKKSQLQVELARLRYELPRSETKVRLSKREERPGFMGLGEYDESEERAIKDRIKKINQELEKIENNNEQRREQRRSQGFDLVAIAGYTNAGKSTLLRQLATDHDVDENKGKHDDLDPTAESTENYFTTLDTTTRRMEFKMRDVLLTDTVGFIDDLPEWLIKAFAATFDSIYRSDLVLLVIDITEDIDEIRRKIATSHDVMSQERSTRILTVFNKIDQVDDSEISQKRSDLSTLAPNPVFISSEAGTGIDRLKQRMHRALPPFKEDTLLLPMEDKTMSLVSWIYNNTNVQSCTYTPDSVIIDYEGREWVVEKAKSKAGSIIQKDVSEEQKRS